MYSEKANHYAQLTEDENAQNRFTAYLIKALSGRRNRYLKNKAAQERIISLEEITFAEDLQDESAIEEIEQVGCMDDLESMLSSDRLLIAVLSLSERERQVLNMRLVQEMKNRQIAEALGMSISGIEKCYARMMFKLRKRMGGGNDE